MFGDTGHPNGDASCDLPVENSTKQKHNAKKTWKSKPAKSGDSRPQLIRSVLVVLRSSWMSPSTIDQLTGVVSIEAIATWRALKRETARKRCKIRTIQAKTPALSREAAKSSRWTCAFLALSRESATFPYGTTSDPNGRKREPPKKKGRAAMSRAFAN